MQPFVLRRLAQGQWHLFGPPVIRFRGVSAWRCIAYPSVYPDWTVVGSAPLARAGLIQEKAPAICNILGVLECPV